MTEKEKEKATELVETKDDMLDLMSGIDGYEDKMTAIRKAEHANINVGEIQIARLGLAQSGTPEVEAEEEGWKAGLLFNTNTREILSRTKPPQWLLDHGVEDAKDVNHFDFLPIFKLPTEYVKWPTQDERMEEGRKNPHWKSLDPTEDRVIDESWPPIGRWRGKGSPPVTAHINILGIGVDPIQGVNTSLLIASFSKTSYPTGRRLVNNIAEQENKGFPTWATVYHIFGDKPKGETKGNYKIFNFARGKKITEYFEDREVAREIFTRAFNESSSLADGEAGRTLQESYLNIAEVYEDDDNEDEGGFNDNAGNSGAATTEEAAF